MRWSCDRTGFPYLHLTEVGLAVALLPITKVQFEYWLADPTGPGEEWYAELLMINPRVSWRTFHPDHPEGLFLTGITPDETLPFLRWLGHGYRLPAALEWRNADLSLSAAPLDELLAEMRTSPDIAPPALAILEKLHQIHDGNVRRIAGFEGGIIEWVLAFRSKAGGYGRPHADFFHVLLNPRIHEPVQPIGSGRQSAFGFRPVRTLVNTDGHA